MMNKDVKKARTIEALKAANLYEVFRIQDKEDFVLFQTEQNIKTGRCLITLDIDDSVFNSIYFFLGNLDNPGKKEKMLALMNEFNKDGLLIKYFLDDNNAIMARIVYIVENEDFNGEFFVELSTTAFNIISNKHYQQIMRLMWA